MPRISQYPNCCGVFNLSGFGPGGTSRVEQDTITPEKLSQYLTRMKERVERRAFVTAVVDERQYRDYKGTFEKHGFKSVAEGCNVAWHGHNLHLLVCVLNDPL